MTEEDKENKYQKFFQSYDDKKNQNSSNSSNSQNSTSESSDGDVISDQFKEPQNAKSFVPEILTEINEHTTLSEGHQILKKFCDKTLSAQEHNIKKTLIPTSIKSNELNEKKQVKSSKKKKNMFIIQKQDKKQDKNYLGKKRSHPDTSDYELEMEKAIKNALIDTTQFLNEISTKVYKNNELNLIIREDFSYHKEYLDKSIQEILLEENIGHQEKESIEYKIKCLLELEQAKKYDFLPFCEKIIKMKLKDLLLVYINDRKCSLITIDGTIQLKTLKDNPYFTSGEKEKLKMNISYYLNDQIKQIPSTKDNGGTKVQPLSNLNHFHNDDNKEKKPRKRPKIRYKIRYKEKTHQRKKFHIKGEEPKNLKRITIEYCFLFLIQMIGKILKDKNADKIKIKNLKINHNITGNSAEIFLKFFNKEIGEILKESKEEYRELIMGRNDTSKETEFLKWLLSTEFIKVVNIFINDKSFSTIYSKEFEPEFKTFKHVPDSRIKTIEEGIAEFFNGLINPKNK